HGLRAHSRKVVAIKSDIKHTDGRTITFEVGDLLRHAFGERNAAPPDPNEEQVAGAMIFFNDFGGKTSQCAIDARAIHNASFLDEFHVCARILTRSVWRDKLPFVLCALYLVFCMDFSSGRKD